MRAEPVHAFTRNMSKPTILVCGPPLSALGGGPTHIRNMLASPLAERYLLAHFETGSRGTESPADDEGMRGKVARLVTSPLALAWQIVRSRPDVVHLNSAMDHRAFWRDLVYMAVCKVLGRKVVLQLHGGSLAELCAGAWMRRMVQAVYAMPDALVLLARSEKRDLATLGVERCHVIPNGVDVRQYRIPGVRHHSGQVRRIAFLGRLIRAKGVFEVMEAVRRLRSQPGFSGLALDIAGSGPDEPEIRAWIRDNAMDGCVRLRGSLYGAEKVAFLRAADVLAFPTYHQEGLPYVILESLSAGTPVIATRNAGIPDVVTDRVHGRLIEPKDPAQVVAALRELAGSPATLQAMSRDCMQQATEAFSLERLAAQLQELYEGLEPPGGVAGATSN